MNQLLPFLSLPFLCFAVDSNNDDYLTMDLVLLANWNVQINGFLSASHF